MKRRFRVLLSAIQKKPKSIAETSRDPIVASIEDAIYRVFANVTNSDGSSSCMVFDDFWNVAQGNSGKSLLC